MYQEQQVSCPYCGEVFTAFIDASQGNHETVEDCYVCCRPIEFIVEIREGVDGQTVSRVDTYTDDESVM